jgi:exodeoxyribonuclease V gamma subunit
MLADLVAEPLEDPMVAEMVAVPTRGIERWLSQRLSSHLGVSPGQHDGVCANIDFPFPGTLVTGALARAAGVDPDADPWAPQRSVWPLIEVVESHFDQPWLRPLAEHMRNSGAFGETKRFSSVRHMADLFDRYAVHRPEMLQLWATGSMGAVDETGVWQFELWSRLRERIGQPSPAERLLEACTRLRDDAGVLDWPRRLSLFGLTRLPASYLDVIDAIAAGREFHLFLLHPSPVLWDRLAGVVGPGSRFVARDEDPTADAVRNQLLASWGRDAREMQLVLGGAIAHLPDTDEESGIAPVTLLQRMQGDIRADRPPPGHPLDGQSDERALLEPGDDSVRVHACHGRGRQVEVLRDALLHLLENDPTLEPRDIIVMCPDIESFAPLIQATFGGHDPSAGTMSLAPELEVRLADRSLRQTNPIMAVLAEVLELATARVTATEVLDLAGRDPVRRRFRFTDEDLSRLEEWVERAEVRWGFDAEHRKTFQLETVESNTWRSGVSRILLGVAMADERQRLFGGVLPLDDVDSSDIDLVGRVSEFLDRLERSLDSLTGTRDIRGWAATLAEISDSMSLAPGREAWQHAQLKGMLDELVGEATGAGGVSAVLLSSDDVRSIVSDRLRGQPTRANFRTGHVTVCTLVPMRSIPHRVVCLLGLDDGSFPRHIERDGDDLTAARPRVGDRDVRSEDRQLLLDALLAARDHVVVTFTGRDERSNLPRPPAVPVGELLGVIDHTVRTPNRRARDAIVIHHALQPFDPRNFTAGAVMAGTPWSFDRLHLAGARAAQAQRGELRSFLEAPLPMLDQPTIAIDSLERFLRHPVRAFLRERLRVSLRSNTREFDDAIPIDLNGLDTWQIADRMLKAQLAGASAQACVDAELARGALPPGLLGQAVLDDIEQSLSDLVAAGRSAIAPTSLDVNVELSATTDLVGTVAGLRGDVVHAVSYSTLAPTARLFAWVRLLALSAAWPDRCFEALTIGRAAKTQRGCTVSVARLGPLSSDPDERRQLAETHLRTIVDLYQRGMCEPLPLYNKASAAWATAAAVGDPTKAAAKEWTSPFGMDFEDKNLEHVLVLGGALSFEAMVERSGVPKVDEQGEGWDGDQNSRFGRYAHRLWDGLLEYEEITHS